MIWTEQYLSIPFEDHGRDMSGCDCYGLLRIVYLREFGIHLPILLDGYDSTEDRKVVENLLSNNAMVIGFQQVELKEAQPFDVLIIRQAGVNCHLGIVVQKGLVLHTEQNKGVVVEDYNRPHLKPRVREIWRYVGK